MTCNRCGYSNIDVFTVDEDIVHCICLNCDQEWVE